MRNGGVCGSSGLCWVQPLPTGRSPTSVWGTADDDVWAVFDGGVVLHWDGNAWSGDLGVGAPGVARLTGTSRDDVWGVGEKGLIVHFDGTCWCNTPGGTDASLVSVSAVSASDAWVTGGATLHWDGQTWTKVDATVTLNAQDPPVPIDPLVDIWASGSNDVWATKILYGCCFPGAAYTTEILHWDGSSWSERGSSGFPVIKLWGSSSSDIWAAGTRSVTNTIISPPKPAGAHWDGTAWTTTPGPVPVGDFLTGRAANDVWAGDGVALNHWDGTAWTSVPPPFPGAPSWESPSGDLWLGAQPVSRWNAGDPRSPNRHPADLTSLWAASATSMWAVGDKGIVLHFDGSSWRPVTNPATDNLRAAWGRSDADFWIVGEHNIIQHWQGGQFTTPPPPPAPPAGMERAFTSVWTDPTSPVIWMAAQLEPIGTGSTAQLEIERWDGHAWAVFQLAPDLRFEIGAEVQIARVSMIRGAGGADVWAVGSHVWRWDGTSWALLSNPSDFPVHGILGAVAGAPGEIWVADGGGLYRGDGTSWNKVFAPPDDQQLVLMRGDHLSNIWMISEFPHTYRAPLVVYRWDGTKPTIVRPSSVSPVFDGAMDMNVADLVPLGAKEAWVVGNNSIGHLDAR